MKIFLGLIFFIALSISAFSQEHIRYFTSMESELAGVESPFIISGNARQQFSNINTSSFTFTPDTVLLPGVHIAPGEICELDAQEPLGPVLVVDVKAGDVINASVQAGWGGGQDAFYSEPDILEEILLDVFVAMADMGYDDGQHTYANVEDAINGPSGIGMTGKDFDDQGPISYINYLFLPEGYDQGVVNYQTGFKQIDGNSYNALSPLAIDEFTIPESGVLIVFLTNEGNNNIASTYFDDFEVTIDRTWEAQLDTEWSSIKITKYTKPFTVSPVGDLPQNEINKIDYYDGFGGLRQTNQLYAGPNFEDLILSKSYNTLGEIEKEYQSYPNNTSAGGYDEDYELNSNNYYVGRYRAEGQRAWQEYQYEPNMLGRISSTIHPGADWQNHPSTEDRRPSNELIYRWELNAAGYPYVTAYNSTDLWEEVSTDADGKEIKKVFDKENKLLVSFAGNGMTSVYHVYDELNRLAFVIQPEFFGSYWSAGQTGTPASAHIDLFAFQYKYDDRNRVVQKKLPGIDWVYYVFDEWDRLVLTQDGNMRNNNEWLFNSYDASNRVIMTGFIETGPTMSHQTMQDHALEFHLHHETRSGLETFGYTQNAFPNGSALFTDVYVEAVTYFDDYNFSMASDFDFTSIDPSKYEVDYLKLPQGEMTGNISKTTDGQLLMSVFYYDEFGRVIQMKEENIYNEVVTYSNAYNFSGNIVHSRMDHSENSQGAVVDQRITYDHTDRVKNTFYQIDQGEEVLLSQKNYNEVGELIEQNLHSADDGPFLQSIDMHYNIRGWLSAINDPQLSDGEGDLFGMKLYYNDDPLSTSTDKDYYNGNISAMQWSDSWMSGGYTKTYSYTYDALERLTSADYRQNSFNTTKFDLDYVSYDLNGNIKNLVRYGEGGFEIDNLLYDYNGSGNQLLKVSDSENEEGFDDGNTSGNDYDYDLNGNMKWDKNKGIENIYYNRLNLPTRVNFNAQDYIRYNYTSDGVKLQQKVYEGGALMKTTDYVNEFIYEKEGTESRKLSLIQHEEGRIVPTYSVSQPETIEHFDYQYHLKDHLGNVRLTFSSTPESYTMIETFETGEDNGFQDLHRHVNANANTTSGGNEVERLQSGQTGGMVFLSLNRGDTINLSVNANYESSPSGNSNIGMDPLDLFDAFEGVYYGAGEGMISIVEEDAFFDAFSGMSNKADQSTAPRAYLNYILFDRSMMHQGAGFVQVSTAAQGVGSHEMIALNNIVAEDGGYILAYLSNENAESLSVYFDDFTVEQIKREVVQSDDYYPFGLTFNSYQRTAASPNKMNTFQDQEYEDETGWVKFKWRNHQPEIGRFFNIDPLSEDYLYNSTYAFSENAVVSHFELEGLEKISIHVYGEASNTNTGASSSIAGQLTVDFGNANRIDYAVGASNSDYIMQGNIIGDNSNVSYSPNKDFTNSTLEEINNLGIKVNDDLAAMTLNGAVRNLIETTGDSELDSQIQGVISSARDAINAGGLDLYIGWDGSTTTGGTDENGNATVRTFTGEVTLLSKPIVIEVDGVKYQVVFKFKYTHQKTDQNIEKQQERNNNEQN